MLYTDEIENLNGLGKCVADLLIFGGFDVKDELWDLLDDALSDSAFEDLKDVVLWWAEERRT